MIGAAATAENAHLLKRAPEIQITPPEIDRVARIERFGFVELGMALRRGIGPDAMNTRDPGLARLQRMLEMRWMGAVDQKIFRRSVGLAIHGFDRFPQRFASHQAATVFEHRLKDIVRRSKALATGGRKSTVLQPGSTPVVEHSNN